MRMELVGRAGHIQGLMRPPVVVLLTPRIDGGLGFLDRGERPGVIEELDLQGLVPALDLPRRSW
jgi:hypothetical protein